MKRNTKRKNEGITLIALVITIIVLLILAGVTIATLTGDNGILTKASDAAERTEKANVIEQAQTDILGIQAENKNGTITQEQLKTVLDKYFDDVPEDFTIDDVFITKDEYGNHEIAVSEIYNGNLGEAQEVISKTESYVGYYADLNNDGLIKLEDDGIIYADLAIGGSGIWNDDDWSEYNYEAVKSGINEYIVKTETTNLDPLKTGKGIIQLSKENMQDRFYVMALKDVNPGTTYCWYDAAYDDGGKLNNILETNENDFGQGKTNTADVLDKWKAEEWGKQNDNGTYKDMWGEIEEEIKAGWFVPSKSEWAAFGDYLYTNCGLTTSNYEIYGLGYCYWSSSQSDTGYAYNADFDYGYITNDFVNSGRYVRLSTTF